jgi:hypothetical protein
MYRSSFVLPGSLLLLLLLVGGADLHAQQRTLLLKVGDVARITGPQAPGGRVTGVVRRIDGDSLVLDPFTTTERVVLPVASVQVAEVANGRSLGKGLVIGAGLGLASGVALALACNVVCAGDGGPNIGIGIGILLAPPVGAIAGLAFAPRRWARLPLPR